MIVVKAVVTPVCGIFTRVNWLNGEHLLTMKNRRIPHPHLNICLANDRLENSKRERFTLTY